MRTSSVSSQMVRAARRLNAAVSELQFGPPVAYVYNPLAYAWRCHAAYLRRYAATRKRVVFLGMNPGPFGMVQTGVPFGEVAAVRDWLRIQQPIASPLHTHARRPVEGFACRRSEVSGRRLWGLFADRFSTPQAFSSEHLVLNYCPLAFLEPSGRNRTPDKLPVGEQTPLFAACDDHLRTAVELLQPEWLIGIGGFAHKRAAAAVGRSGPKLGHILHPSPANPAANRGWEALATRQLAALGVWRS